MSDLEKQIAELEAYAAKAIAENGLIKKRPRAVSSIMKEIEEYFQLKKCGCGYKPFSEFSRKQDNRHGLDANCNTCRGIAKKPTVTAEKKERTLPVKKESFIKIKHRSGLVGLIPNPPKPLVRHENKKGWFV